MAVDSLGFKLVTSRLRLGILLVIGVQSTIEHDCSRQVTDDLVVVSLLCLVIEVVGSKGFEVVSRDDRHANLGLFVVHEFR